jgi:hypothetical protein
MSDTSSTEEQTLPKAGLGGAPVKPEPGETARMVASPPTPAEPPKDEQPQDPQERQPGDELRKQGAPDGLAEAAAGPLDEGLSDADHAEANRKEAGALDFLLSNPSPTPFKCEVMVDTPAGLKPLTFHMHQLDGKRIEKLENDHTNGVGPFATVDRLRLNAAKVAEATDRFVDANGKEMTPGDPQFLADAIAPEIAFERMFRFQPGVGDQLAERIDQMAGMTRDRVGIAERETVAAVGNS